MGRNKRTRKTDVPTKSKLKKDPGIPKLPDLKTKKNVERQRKVSRTVQPPTLDPDAPMASEPTLSSLAALAEQSESSNRMYDDTIGDPSSSGDAYKVQLRRQYIRTLHKVIEESDIVILVLDARDPEGCRSRLVEEEVRRREHEGKRLVFVLNKIDLVPRENAEAWLRYLRHTTPTLPFRASTQHQRSNLLSKTSPALLNLLKSYKRTAKAGSITVGVVGYPNVGKSSLINSLRRSKVCAVSAEAGFTKEMQAVQIERGVRVLDSPGVVFDDEEQESGNILLRNVIKVEDIQDPIAVVDQILAKTDHTKLQQIYILPSFSSTLELLTMVALSSGRLHKGGTPDVLAAARQILHDWNAHKIPYYTYPPSVHPSSVPSVTKDGRTIEGTEDVGSAMIVKEFAPSFDLGGLFDQADTGAFEDTEMQVEEEGSGSVQMESDDLAPKIPRKRSRSSSPSPSLARSRSRAPSPSPSVSRLLAAGPLPNTPTPSPYVTRASTNARSQTDLESSPPPAKRLKRSESDSPSPSQLHLAPGLASQNPLSRRALRKDAKKARKTARRANRALRSQTAGATGGGMEIDDEGGLEFTFMADVNGIVSHVLFFRQDIPIPRAPRPCRASL